MIDNQDPLAVFRAAVTAINAEDWIGAAALVDPVSLRVFHRHAVAGLTEPRPAEVLTVEEVLRHARDTPRAVAEDLVARATREADPAYRLAREFPQITSTEQLEALTPLELFSHWLEGKSQRRKYQALVAAGRLPAEPLELRSRGSFGGCPYVPVGSVAEGDALAHVLYRHTLLPRASRMSTKGARLTPGRPSDEEALEGELAGHTVLYVTTLRRQPEGGWRFIITDDFLRMRATHLQGVGFMRRADGADASGS